MNYAIQILDKEKIRLEKCINKQTKKIDLISSKLDEIHLLQTKADRLIMEMCEKYTQGLSNDLAKMEVEIAMLKASYSWDLLEHERGILTTLRTRCLQITSAITSII